MHYKNQTSVFIFFVSLVVLVGLFVFGFLQSYDSILEEIDWGNAIKWWTSAIVVGALLNGIAEIIEILSRIEGRFEKSEEQKKGSTIAS